MTKSFNEMGNLLKEYIIELQSDAHNVGSFTSRRYNNLKLSMSPKRERKPHLIVRIGMSEAGFGVPDGEKLWGGLGMDERLVLRWLGRANIMEELGAMWRKKVTAKIDLSKREDEEDE